MSLIANRFDMVFTLSDGTPIRCNTQCKALIDGDVFDFDFASINFDAYECLHGKIRYLGSGTYFQPTYYGLYHFWAWK